jgi:hypothetical protein
MVGDVVVYGATRGRVQHLHAWANAEEGLWIRSRPARQRRLGRVAAGVHAGDAGIQRGATAGRIYVTAAGLE